MSNPLASAEARQAAERFFERRSATLFPEDKNLLIDIIAESYADLVRERDELRIDRDKWQEATMSFDKMLIQSKIALIHEGWQLAHDPAQCGHPRANWQDRNWPLSHQNYDPETKTANPPMDYRCLLCTVEEERDRWQTLFYESEEENCSCNIVDTTKPIGDPYNYVCEWHEKNPRITDARKVVLTLAERAEAAESLNRELVEKLAIRDKALHTAARYTFKGFWKEEDVESGAIKEVANWLTRAEAAINSATPLAAPEKEETTK